MSENEQKLNALEKRSGLCEMSVDTSDLSLDQLQALAGLQDANYQVLEKEMQMRLYPTRDGLRMEGENMRMLEKAAEVLQSMLDEIEDGQIPDAQETRRLALLALKDRPQTGFTSGVPIARTRSGKMIYPKTYNQQVLADAFRNEQIIFASGVAGTGKTYLAVAWAVDQLKREKINRIILTRPAVEAGESPGFLPGDMKEKVDPYLQPLYDALNDMLGAESVERLIEKGTIEIAPLAFMRGRTLNDAVVILDEAQNTTGKQMKMFLTRMGRNCQMIVTGDATQIDLAAKKDCGLKQACQLLKGIDGISVVTLDETDVVRNPLVQKIIERYATVEQE